MQSNFPVEISERLENSGIIAVVTIDNPIDAVPLADALKAGGITQVELTLRTPNALEAIANIKSNRPEFLVGAGTVLSTTQVKQAKDAGADFAVSPGLNSKVIKKAQSISLPFAPGILTPTELEKAISLGCDNVKIFPAGPAGGINYLKSLAAPYKHLGIRYMPLGGVSAANICEYLEYDSVLAIGGSWIAPKDLIAENRWDQIEHLANHATDLANSLKN